MFFFLICFFHCNLCGQQKVKRILKYSHLETYIVFILSHRYTFLPFLSSQMNSPRRFVAICFGSHRLFAQRNIPQYHNQHIFLSYFNFPFTGFYQSNELWKVPLKYLYQCILPVEYIPKPTLPQPCYYIILYNIVSDGYFTMYTLY